MKNQSFSHIDQSFSPYRSNRTNHLHIKGGGRGSPSDVLRPNGVSGRGVAIAAIAFALGAVAVAQAPPSAAALARTVDAHYNHLQSMTARYTERYRGMGMDRSESGTLLLQKPGKMRWAYDSPAGKVFLLDGRNAITYTPGDAQAQEIPEKDLDDLRSPLRFLLGHTELAKELTGLTLTLVKLEDGSTGYTLSGAPKGMDARVRMLAVTVDAKGEIHGLRIEEIDGATTEFAFSAVKENVATKVGDFVFVAPKGVEVVKGAKPI
jgi:outer membrane lipoprotein carrier protein